MTASLSLQQLTALRALREGRAPLWVRLGAAAGVTAGALRNKARREGWGAPLVGWARETEADDDLPREAVAGEAVASEGGAAIAGETGEGDAGGSVEERLARVVDGLLGEVEAIGTAASARKRPLDKARIDALGAMVRTLEKFEGFARERAGQAQIGRDKEIGDVLSRIDGRIVELAHAYAEELVARRIAGGELVAAEPHRE